MSVARPDQSVAELRFNLAASAAVLASRLEAYNHRPRKLVSVARWCYNSKLLFKPEV